MFSSMMKYRFICQLRAKESIFWVLVFPIILSILFYAALRDINKGETFETPNIAVVDDENFKNEVIMSEIITSVSADSKEEVTKDTLFITNYVSADKAEKMLKDKDICGYIYFNDGCNLVIAENGISQTIVKTFLDIAKNKVNVVEQLMSKNGGKMPENIESIMADSTQYIIDASNRQNAPDTSLQFFYTVLGMACMYGATIGCVAITYIQSNQSSIAKRNTVAPIGKMKLLLSSFIVDMLMNDAIILMVLGFIRFVLGINFGDRYVLIILTSIVGATTGLSFGYFFGAVTKKSLSFKNNMVIGISMICSFLAGMMTNKIKYIVKQKAYIVDRINPVNLITESYFKLYYYTNLDKFYENIIILLAMTGVFVVGTVLILNYQEKNLLKERSR